MVIQFVLIPQIQDLLLTIPVPEDMDLLPMGFGAYYPWQA